ncbi:MAG TPA: acyl-CoA dehydrogenase family protein [Alphaproteobacteria bacterium]|nr:acyl-CoA dehydrogenase family protein [Alphaproteobacteria bacterium]
MTDRFNDIQKTVRGLKPLIEASRAEAERLKRLPDSVATAFLEHDLYRILVPEDLGGAGLDPLEYFDLCQELASYDGSAGWNFALASTTSPLVGMLPLARLRTFFAEPDCAIAGTVGPSGKAEKVSGGWRLTGRWSWMSGVHQAKWVILGAFVYENGAQRMNADGTPETRQFLLHKDPAHVLDVWDVGGMRGTGSTDYACEGAFTADEMWVRAFSGQSNHPDPIFRLPFVFFGLGLCAVALGIARPAVDGLKMLAAGKVSAVSRKGLRDQGQAQHAVAKSEALLRSSGLYVRECFGAIWNALSSSNPITLEMRGRARGSYVHAAESALQSVQLCYRAAGGSGLWEKGPFEQALRDVNAVACHITMQETMLEEAGRIDFGMQPTVPFV